MNTNTEQPLGQSLRRKHKGWAFMFAMMSVVAVLLISLLIYQKERLHLAKEKVEDALTGSALGSLSMNYGIYISSDNRMFNDREKAYEDLCNLIGSNLSLHRNGTYYSTSEISNYNGLLNTDKYPACLKKAILYEIVGDKVIAYIYNSTSDPSITHPANSEKSNLSKTPYSDYSITIEEYDINSKAPNGAIIDTVGIYMEFKFPLKIFNNEKYITKNIYVDID